ncbi:hypothetical protein FRC01_005802 [Tulasnella sp. 417]|nr:hypothetical protein FRC01_005802 [Tulasnella sp. 417]
MDSEDLPEDSDVVFKGVDGAEAESFIMSVQRIARKEGKSRDNEWIADLVASCLTGEALRWYVDQHEDTQNDWRRLRKAILQRYPSHTESSSSSLQRNIPTPAAAVTPPIVTSLRKPTPASNSTYHIRVYFGNTRSNLVLSTNDNILVCLTRNAKRGLNVCWTPKKELQLMEKGTKTRRRIGLIWHLPKQDRHKPGSTNDFAFVFLSDSKGNVPPFTTHTGALQMTRWSVDSDGWLQSYSEFQSAEAQNQFYTAPGGYEGSLTQACLIPGISHWKLQDNQVFVRFPNLAEPPERVCDL